MTNGSCRAINAVDIDVKLTPPPTREDSGKMVVEAAEFWNIFESLPNIHTLGGLPAFVWKK